MSVTFGRAVTVWAHHPRDFPLLMTGFLITGVFVDANLTKSTVMQRYSNSYWLAWIFQITEFLPPWYLLCASSHGKARNLAQTRCLCYTCNEWYSQGEICLVFFWLPSLSSMCLQFSVTGQLLSVQEKKPRQNQIKKTPTKPSNSWSTDPWFLASSGVSGQDGWARQNNK